MLIFLEYLLENHADSNNETSPYVIMKGEILRTGGIHEYVFGFA